MNNKEVKKLISNAYYRLVLATDNVSWTHYADELYKIEKEYEKNHRRYTECDYVFSINDCAKYWAVKHIIDGLNDTKELNVKSYLHLKKSIFYAYSMVANYRDRIEKEFIGFDFQEFSKINITEWKQGKVA
jgi:hypothetical protein